MEPVDGTLTRIVESQEQVATTGLVDTLEEQGLLEDMLDTAKPPPRPGSEGLHYLLMTPFRYPPLRHGSRFGHRYEPSILYGSLSAEATLAEAAYYRLVFRSGMETPPAAPIRSRHTLFRANYRARRGLRLHRSPCNEKRAILTDPADYAPTQALGSAMREAVVLAFEFHSARDPQGGINVGLFEPTALSSRAPTGQEQWLCEVGDEQVTFLHPASRRIERFPAATFLIDGRLPQPAT
ncbi:RES family NAD+ phosphorylase [Guyparkeria hydrothermalis]|uniref:RES family NAD+ phosphorylase n=1 Tax=Guyparkeria hydrothermalis TaxID=923 RepID=UPI0020205098|nr:RES family NAD+ phosphorylase [Guyparkeria hydrothermalis]MCL7745004.1 RES family NAD+ phosphorylase [Guyparkeria hydrothermalis]